MDRRKRVIALLLEELHDHCNDLYESLMDEDYSQSKVSLEQLKTKLKYIKETFIDEI
jgi:hypothetical protein